MKKYIVLFKLSIISLFFLSCSNNDQNEEEVIVGEPIGLISAEEFNAVPPPTFQEFLDAAEIILNETPDLKDNEELLARAIFDLIALNNDTQNKEFDRSSRNGPFFDLLNSMTIEEWRIVLTNPFDALISLPTIDISLGSAKEQFPCDNDINFDGGKADALRHALWNALMVRRTNFEFAEAISTAHESETSDERSKIMDLSNNAFGRNIALAFPEATDQQILELLLEQNYTFIPENQEIASQQKALIFIRGERGFDVAMQGSFSNPDSGGPWDINIILSQCDNIIRGRFTITRGEALQERRFSGVLNNNQIILDVSNPFVFENPEGLQACENVTMTLEGDPSNLSGFWTSSNCRLGGVVELSVTN